MEDTNCSRPANERLPMTQQPFQPFLPASGSDAFIEATPGGRPLDVPKLLRRYLLLAIVLTIIGAGCGFVAVAFFPPRFKARATLEVQPMNTSVLKIQGFENGGGEVDLQTEAQVLLSNTFLRHVLQRLQLEGAPAVPQRNDIFSRLRRRLKISDRDTVPVAIGREGLEGERVPKPLALALRSVEAHPIDRTRILEVTCESTSPELAANFLNSLADEYIQQNVQSRLQTVQLTTQWLSQQLQEAKSKMLEADQRLQAFVQKSGDLFVAADQQDAGADSQLQGLQDRLSTAEADLIQKQTRAEMVAKAPSDTLPEVLDDPTVRAYQSKIADLTREEAVLTTSLMPANPKVKTVEVQIAGLRANLQKEITSVLKRITVEYQIAKRNRDALRSAYAAQVARVDSQGTKAAEYSALKRESESARQMYNTLLLQANQASIAGSVPVNNIRITDRAIPPQEPYKPKPLMIIAAGAGAGLGLCAGLAFLRETLDRRVSSPHEARQLFNLPQLGVIPSVQELTKHRNILSLGAKGILRNELKVTLSIVNAAEESTGQSSTPFNNYFFAESFRTTLASLMRESVEPKAQVIQVTSPGPGEGKTMVASNLAIALAETGRRVLVLDADFRRPSAHRVLGIPNGHGLVDLITEEVPIGEYPKDRLGTRTSIPNLSVLPNGTRLDNITKALYSTRLRQLLQRLRREFDTILVDTPPILGVADARVISQMADGVVLVLRSGLTDKDRALEALDQLRADGTIVLGTVLNDWKLSKSEAKRKYYYSSPAQSGA
jgi:polysaccharide biosynthesis transport protein